MRRWAAALAAVLLLTGCSSLAPAGDKRAEVSQSQLGGTWQATGGGVISFTEDGTFLASDLPHQMFDGFTNVLPPDYRPGRDKLRAAGSWELRAGLGDPDGPKNHVYLHVRELFGHEAAGGTDLEAEQGKDGVVLTYYAVDPDLNQRITWTKCSETSSTNDPPSC
ncbi:hypothetical protein ACQPZX_32480 [Actinoplanes sp. CA-142083]|uniref:hypothetical protein n=1 Tax=Actinoplanes sp. CA-142083 TaxID=3239903 RepID=UPI003D8FACA0